MECIHYIGTTFNNFGDKFILQRVTLLWQIANDIKEISTTRKTSKTGNLKKWITSLVQVYFQVMFLNYKPYNPHIRTVVRHIIDYIIKETEQVNLIIFTC